MAEQKISFSDGGLYERTMGVWTRLAGDTFLDWLKPAPNQDWIDVGCGNGAFTDLIATRCAPQSVEGIDPSAGQIAYARDRAPGRIARYQEGNALALPYADASFDIAVMALVIFFVPEPAKGVTEMARVVRPGGLVTSYSWDILGGGFPVALLQEEMRAMDMPTPLPPSVEASQHDALVALWADAGLGDIEVRKIAVEQTYANFESFWSNMSSFGSAGAIAKLADAERAELKNRVFARLPPAADGSVTSSASAFAIRGRKPA
jgi:ubiquinone/menaquinone biosynthesis C-methylase UbiE